MAEDDFDSLTPIGIPLRATDTYRRALSFVHRAPRDETRRRELVAQPLGLFRIEGLWLWGTDETTLVHEIRAGYTRCFVISDAPLPGLYFEAGLAFDDFEALLEEAPDDWRYERLKSAPQVPKHQRLRSPTVEIGNSVSLDVEGPLSHAVVWGITVH